MSRISSTDRDAATSRKGRLRRRRRVALLVETSLAPGREILRGIAHYVREQGTWSVYHQPRGLEESVPRWIRRWEGDGIIARVQNERIAQAVAASPVPVVDVLGVGNPGSIPLVHVDDAAIAKLAANHLIDRGFRHFGYVGHEDENISRARRDAFTRLAAQAGYDCAVFEDTRRAMSKGSWEAHLERMRQWIGGLPKPCGLMLCTDQRGPEVLEACRAAGVAVPDEVAVIGVDNDEPLCDVSNPPLSSVWPDHERVGYEGAALLDRIMDGQAPPREPIYIAPARLIPRLSTDVLAVEDREVAHVVRFIREHACEGITVEDVVHHAPFSRSVLQRRFRAALGRTVHEEIIRVRVDRAKELLTETRLPLAVIALRAGFKHQEYMGAVFKSRLDKTPAQIRRAGGE